MRALRAVSTQLSSQLSPATKHCTVHLHCMFVYFKLTHNIVPDSQIEAREMREEAGNSPAESPPAKLKLEVCVSSWFRCQEPQEGTYLIY